MANKQVSPQHKSYLTNEEMEDLIKRGRELAVFWGCWGVGVGVCLLKEEEERRKRERGRGRGRGGWLGVDPPTKGSEARMPTHTSTVLS